MSFWRRWYFHTFIYSQVLGIWNGRSLLNYLRENLSLYIQESLEFCRSLWKPMIGNTSGEQKLVHESTARKSIQRPQCTGDFLQGHIVTPSVEIVMLEKLDCVLSKSATRPYIYEYKCECVRTHLCIDSSGRQQSPVIRDSPPAIRESSPAIRLQRPIMQYQAINIIEWRPMNNYARIATAWTVVEPLLWEDQAGPVGSNGE
jgi:hypothetical protein